MTEGAQTAPIRTLLLEDDAVFAAFVLGVLKRSDTYTFDCRHAATLAEARSILATEKIDGILADLDLPDSAGLDTLAALLEVRRLPIVVLTGSDYLVLARQAMEAGAQDYLVKGEGRGRHIGRALVHAIERHRHLKRLAFSEQRFKDFAEVSSDWLWEINTDSRFSWISDNVRDVLGIDPAGMVGQPYAETICPDEDPDKVASHLARIEAREPFRNFTFRPAAAPERHIRASGKPMTSLSGRFLGYRGASTDVTAEVESQAFAARMLAVLMDSMAAFASGIMIFDEFDHLVFANERTGMVMNGCVDQLVPGTSFLEILRAAADSGTFTDARGRKAAWLEGWQDKSAEDGTFSEPTSAGPALYIHQSRTGTGGMLRVIRFERGAAGEP